LIRKYYLLHKKNEWSKALTKLELLFLILTKKVNQFDVIWHTGLCPKGMAHPKECIHSSIQVGELSSLPHCLFKESFGLSELLRNIKKKLFSKKDGFNRLTETPIETPKLLENAITKKVIPSIRAIQNLSTGGKYSIDLV